MTKRTKAEYDMEEEDTEAVREAAWRVWRTERDRRQTGKRKRRANQVLAKLLRRRRRLQQKMAQQFYVNPALLQHRMVYDLYLPVTLFNIVYTPFVEMRD
jgi:hypothetical protein